MVLSQRATNLVRQRVGRRLRLALCAARLRRRRCCLALRTHALGACAFCAKHIPPWLSVSLFLSAWAHTQHAPLHMLWYAALMVYLAHPLLQASRRQLRLGNKQSTRPAAAPAFCCGTRRDAPLAGLAQRLELAVLLLPHHLVRTPAAAAGAAGTDSLLQRRLRFVRYLFAPVRLEGGHILVRLGVVVRRHGDAARGNTAGEGL